MTGLISVVVPVFHEPEICAFVEDAAAWLDENTELIIVDGAPELDSLARLSATSVCLCAAPPGRGPQFNYGVQVAQGDILLFLHADTRLPPDALELIRRTLRDPQVAGGAFALAYDSDSLLLRCIAVCANLRTRLTRAPYGDQALFIRSTVLRQIGGFLNMPIMEDLELTTRLRRGGYHIRLLSESVRTSARRHIAMGALRCTMRNLWLRACYHLGASSERLARLYRPHA